MQTEKHAALDLIASFIQLKMRIKLQFQPDFSLTVVFELKEAGRGRGGLGVV